MCRSLHLSARVRMRQDEFQSSLGIEFRCWQLGRSSFDTPLVFAGVRPVRIDQTTEEEPREEVGGCHVLQRERTERNTEEFRAIERGIAPNRLQYSRARRSRNRPFEVSKVRDTAVMASNSEGNRAVPSERRFRRSRLFVVRLLSWRAKPHQHLLKFNSIFPQIVEQSRRSRGFGEEIIIRTRLTSELFRVPGHLAQMLPQRLTVAEIGLGPRMGIVTHQKLPPQRERFHLSRRRRSTQRELLSHS